jgi:hypothetical protein
MVDAALVLAFIDGVSGKAEGIAEEIDCGMGIAVIEARYDGGIDVHVSHPWLFRPN